MNDETDKPDDKETDEGEQPLLAGERLAEARRERQISVLEIAKELHLDETKVRALESNDFDSLGAPVFAKGHLRKYAQAVGIDEGDVLAEYYGLTRAQPLPPVVPDRRKPGRELSPGPWFVALAVLVVAAIAYWLLTRQPSVSEPAPPPATVVDPEPARIDDADQPEAQTEVDEPPVTEQETVDAPPAEPQEAAPEDTPEPEPQAIAAPVIEPTAEPPAEGDVRLTIVFVGDCWTEIFDASGRRLYYGLGRAEQSVDVAGEEPLSVLFGDADNVTLFVNGSEFAIADADRRGRTARFNLYAP